MRIGSPRPPSSRGLAASRMHAALAPESDSSEVETRMAHRVKSLRDQLQRGTYRIDPARVAVSMYGALINGGL